MALRALTVLAFAAGEALAYHGHRCMRATTPDGLYIPDQYQLCASEGESCECYGVLIIGDPKTNRWSEPIRSEGTHSCKDSTFKRTLSAKGKRECWCKPAEVARKSDYPQDIPNLSKVKYASDQIATGLVWKAAQDVTIFDSQQSYDLLIVDPSKRKMELAYSEPGLKKTSTMILEHNGIAGVNGGFHAYGRPDVGTITEMRVDGVNIVTQNTPEQWDLTSEDVEGVACINSKGRLEIFSQGERSKWEKQPTYLHVGPLLLLDGVRQPLDSKTWNHVRNPRTGICVLKNGQELLVTVDGRYYYAAGMTVAEFALFMQALGCKSAINLDGGGSTTMWIAGKGVVNEPRDKPSSGQQWDENLTERSISNAFVVV